MWVPYVTLYALYEVSVPPFILNRPPVFPQWRPLAPYRTLWPHMIHAGLHTAPLGSISHHMDSIGPLLASHVHFLALFWPTKLTMWVPMATCAIFI